MSPDQAQTMIQLSQSQYMEEGEVHSQLVGCLTMLQFEALVLCAIVVCMIVLGGALLGLQRPK